MKKFTWRLQRVLDVRIKQEQARRAELLELTHRLSAVRQEIIVRQARVRAMFAALGRKAAAERFAAQAIASRHAGLLDEQVARLKKQLEEIEALRARKTAEMMETRKARKALEKLRAGEYEEFLREVSVAEQKELDERTGVGYARKAVQRTNEITAGPRR